MKSSLQIKDLKASIKDKLILKGVNLEVKPGEVHAIMGPNGSGKSTTANTLAGHPSYEVNSGNVLLDGEDILELSPDERSQKGLFLAFQYPVEVPGVRVLNFLWAAYKQRFPDEKTRKINKIVAFRDHLKTLAKELHVKEELLMRGLNEGFSGGEKKRLEILQMAVLEPKFAILDETDSGLDIDAIKTVAEGVNKIVKDYNTGIIVITHYQRILDYLKPDFVHVMMEGKIVKSGGEEIITHLEEEGYKDF